MLVVAAIVAAIAVAIVAAAFVAAICQRCYCCNCCCNMPTLWRLQLLLQYANVVAAIVAIC